MVCDGSAPDFGARLVAKADLRSAMVIAGSSSLVSFDVVGVKYLSVVTLGMFEATRLGSFGPSLTDLSKSIMLSIAMTVQ